MVSIVTLKGGIIAASGHLGQRVAFQSLVDKLHLEFDSAASGPDPHQLFGFLVGIGVGNNTSFDDLATFQQLLIDSKSREWRFS